MIRMSNAFLTSDIHQPDAIHLIVLTGMSGGGKTVALRALEDLEFYCVDNLPTALLPELVAAVSHGAVAGRRRVPCDSCDSGTRRSCVAPACARRRTSRAGRVGSLPCHRAPP